MTRRLLTLITLILLCATHMLAQGTDSILHVHNKAELDAAFGKLACVYGTYEAYPAGMRPPADGSGPKWYGIRLTDGHSVMLGHNMDAWRDRPASEIALLGQEVTAMGLIVESMPIGDRASVVGSPCLMAPAVTPGIRPRPTLSDPSEPPTDAAIAAVMALPELRVSNAIDALHLRQRLYYLVLPAKKSPPTAVGYFFGSRTLNLHLHPDDIRSLKKQGKHWTLAEVEACRVTRIAWEGE